MYLCGPGDPEGFLYRGHRNADGTRNGDQMQLINKLKGTGANSIYVIAVRTHRGDAWQDHRDHPDIYPDTLHNPWLGQDPANGLNQPILTQWETWFTEADKNGIIIYFYFYDDDTQISQKLGWPLDSSGELHPGERKFIEDITHRFKHHKHLIWNVMEEVSEMGSDYLAHAMKIAEAIGRADDHEHPIGVQQLTGLIFDFPDDPNFDIFGYQIASATPEGHHKDAVKAWANAAGRYCLVGVDLHPSPLTGADLRHKNWMVALGGAYQVHLGMDIISTPIADLEACGRVVKFFESTEFNIMAPHDELAYGSTEYVFAAPGKTYIAYTSHLIGDIGMKNMSSGKYDFKWIDCVNGNTIEQLGVDVSSGDWTWSKPMGIGNEIAVYIKRQANMPK